MNFEAFLDEFMKIAATRSVREWRSLNAAGDQAGADSIARAHAQLGAKPRYLEDISIGGAEAGVDKMMGSANPAAAVAPNESGYIARKLYKPDSGITRGEFTPQLLEQKQRLTDNARALSPEAKAMVPAMYGHQTMGSGPLQRTISHHEYVPGISDLRGVNTGTEAAPNWSRSSVADRRALQQNVLNPMHARGQTMADTVSATGANFGNVVNSPSGPKILDFLPNIQGEKNPTTESFKRYVPEAGSAFDTGSVHDLRKEVFNPKMQITPANPELQHRADVALSARMPQPAPRPATAPTADVPTRITARAAPSVGAGNSAPTRVLAPPAASGAGQLSHAPTMPSAQGAFAHAPTAPSFQAVHLPTVRPALAGAAGRLESAAMKTAPGVLRRATTALSHF